MIYQGCSEAETFWQRLVFNNINGNALDVFLCMVMAVEQNFCGRCDVLRYG